MTDEERMRQIARQAAHEAVAETFRQLGYDVHENASMRELQEDLSWTRNMRANSDRVGGWAIKTVVTTSVGAILYAVYQAVAHTKGGQ